MDTDQKLTLSISAASPEGLLGLLSRLYVVSRSIHAIAELGVANLIGDAPVSVAEVADTVGTSAEYLARCLRFLAAYGVFEETSANRFRATTLSEVMRDDHPRSLRPVLRMVSNEWWDAAGRLPDVIRAGRSGIELARNRTFFEVLKGTPELQLRFSDGMSSISRMDDEALAAIYDFSSAEVIVDLAGGEGNFLREILRKNSGASGVLLEQPQVLAEAKLLNDYVRDGRARLVPGNLFEFLPVTANLHVLKGTLHDFADREAIAILRNCAGALRRSDKLLIIEQVLPIGNVPHPNKTMDMVMMFLLGGKQRSLEEWSDLLSRAGLKAGRVIPTPTPYTIIEAGL